MKHVRVIIETSENEKEALDLAIKGRGTTIKEWFTDKLAEISTINEVAAEYDVSEIKTLENLSDSSQVLERIMHHDWAFTEAKTSHSSHGIHPYPAKYIPQIPRNLIRLLSINGETVWDPFGGSGTTALEALLANRQAISTDLNPIATLVGEAKTTTITLKEEITLSTLSEDVEFLSKNEAELLTTLERHSNELDNCTPNIPNCEKWFHPNASKELAYIKWRISSLDSECAKKIAEAAFSKIIIKASFQDGETRYTSTPKNIQRGTVLKYFSSDLMLIMGRAKRLSPLLWFKKAQFKTIDLRVHEAVQPNSVDLIVTSPPYPNATDYHLYHRFRLFWLGHNPREMGKKEIGSHLRHQKEKNGIEKYLEEMTICLEKMLQALRSGRYAALVIGDAVFKGDVYDTAELVGDCAGQLGFEVVGLVPRKLHDTKRSFISAARRLREEKILILRKPLIKEEFVLNPPNYKMWPYEETIRAMEIENVLGLNSKSYDSDNNKVEIDNYQIDKIRRLTFTHSFESSSFKNEKTWQAILENGDNAKELNKRKDPKYATHGIHAYKGKFYPQLAKSLFNIAGVNAGKFVLDPFCGSGTVLLEGYLNGLNVKGFDLNPLASKIAYVKTNILKIDPYLTDKIISRLIDGISRTQSTDKDREIFSEKCIDELLSWFPVPVLNKLGRLLKMIDEVPDNTIRSFLEICLSSIVRNISQQEPRDLRIRRRKEPITDAPVYELFIKKLSEQRERLRHYAHKANMAPFGLGSAEVFKTDCRSEDSLATAGIAHGSIDAVVTSPPYATALPYIDTDRLSILLLFGLKSKESNIIERELVGSRDIYTKDKSKYEESIENHDYGIIQSTTAMEIIDNVYRLNKNSDVGFRKKNMGPLLYRYFEDMTSVLQNISRAVRGGGSIFFVIGDNKTNAGGCDIVIKSAQVLREIGISTGWELCKTIPITVTQENRLHNKNGITENDIIWFKK